jgi:hypothetical protein
MSNRRFSDALLEYFTNVGRVLRAEADVASVFPNPTDVGKSREDIYAEVLKQHLPSTCNVALGGFLFDQEGNESRQIDILITNEASLQFKFFDKTFACIDGCIGIVSVKSKLDSSELIDSLDNIASIPEKQRLSDTQHSPLLVIPDYEDLPFKIVYASNGISLPTLLDSLKSFYLEHSEIPVHKRPNLIHVAGQYIIVRSKWDSVGPNGTEVRRDEFVGMPDSTDFTGLLTAIVNVQEAAMKTKGILYCYRKMFVLMGKSSH